MSTVTPIDKGSFAPAVHDRSARPWHRLAGALALLTGVPLATAVALDGHRRATKETP